MRKNAKRIMAVVTAATMALGSCFTAMAASTKPSDSTITGGGDLDYVDTSTVYEVTLPTAGALDFVIDPQGLTSLKDGESAKLDELLDNSSIVSKGNAGAYIKNESSIGVKVTAKMSITDTNDAGKVTPVDTLDAVTANTTTNICLLAIPSSNSPAAIDNYEASAQGIVIESVDDTNPTEFSFVLDKASYSIKNDNGTLSYAIDETEDNYDAASFKLGGKANGKANWSAYVGDNAKSIGVKAVFSVADAADTDVAKDGYSAHGLMDLDTTSTKSVSLTPPTPSVTANGNFSISKNNTFALKNVTKAIAKIEAAENADGGTVYGEIPTSAYSVNADKTVLTIDGAKNTLIGAGGIGKSRCFIITFEGDDTPVKVTVTVEA